MSGTDFPLPADLPRPTDDGAADHLRGMTMPSIVLRSTSGRLVDVGRLNATASGDPEPGDPPPADPVPGDRTRRQRTVVYCYPTTGVPGKALPKNWDSIPGARGCTPQTCSFRDHHKELSQLGADVFGLSTQTTEYQREMAGRLHLPFDVLSDADYALTEALRLPTFEVEGMRLMKRVTLIVREGSIEHVFYPVFPPDESADQVVRWLRSHPIG